MCHVRYEFIISLLCMMIRRTAYGCTPDDVKNYSASVAYHIGQSYYTQSQLEILYTKSSDYATTNRIPVVPC